MASANVLNYFSTFADGNTADGQTGQGCTLGGTVSAANCRGADNAAESARRWNFGTADNLADYAFVVIDGTFMRLGGVAEAGLPGEAGNLLQTGEQVFSLSLGAGARTASSSVSSTWAISGSVPRSRSARSS